MLNYRNENRNCGCHMMNHNNSYSGNDGCANSITNYDCSYTPQGINAAFGYNTLAVQEAMNNCGCSNDMDQCCEDRMQTRREMLNQIRCLNFAIIDLSEYLNTHPNDERAICLHREYCNKYKELTDSYQKVYGPLSIYFPCNKWRWLEEPWPWEGGEC